MSKIREKESLECWRMHIWALKTQKLPGPLSRPLTPAANCSLHYVGNFQPQNLGPPLTKSWIRTSWSTLHSSLCLIRLIFNDKISCLPFQNGKLMKNLKIRGKKRWVFIDVTNLTDIFFDANVKLKCFDFSCLPDIGFSFLHCVTCIYACALVNVQ